MKSRLTSAALALAAVLAVPALAPLTAAAPATASNKVLVIPFTTLNLPADQQWIGRAVQETLIADLGKTAEYSPIAFQGQTVVEDNATAARVGKESATPFVVRGAAQFVNHEVRLTAQLIDATTGDSVSTAIATGPENSLLKLEDDVAAQLRIVPVAGASAVAAAPNAAAPAVAAPAAPAVAAPSYPAVAAPSYTPAAAVYPPAPYNDIFLSAQDYNAVPYDYGYGYSYPVTAYASPSYCYPTYAYPTYTPYYSGIFIGSGPRFFRSPSIRIGRSFSAPVGHFGGGGFRGGGVGGGFHTGGFGGGGFHGGGGSRGGGHR